MAKKKTNSRYTPSQKKASKKASPKERAKRETSSNMAFVPALSWEKGFWKRHWPAAALIFGLALALYGMTITYDYVLDDMIVISQNKYTKKGFSGIREIMTTEHFQGYLEDQKAVVGDQSDLVEGGRYRPLSTVTFAIETGLWGQNPRWSHLINILMYGLTGLLLFRVLMLLLPGWKEKKWYLAVPFLASLLFILHPIHSEAVANIKGRDEILALLLALATLYYSLKYVASNQKIWLGATGIVFLLSILAKESTLPFFAIIPLSLYYFTKSDKKQLLTITAVLGLTFILYLVIRINVIGFLFGSGSGKVVDDLLNNPFRDAVGTEKIGTILFTWLVYLKLLVFPHPLTHDYYPFHIAYHSLSDPWVILSILIYLGLGIYALLDIKKKGVLSYGIWFYLLSFSIVSNLLIGLGTFMNERFMFIPSVGFCIALVYLLVEWLPQKLKKEAMVRQVGIGLLAVFAVGFVIKTYERIPAWESNLSLDAAGVITSSNSAHSNQFYAYELYRNSLEEGISKDSALSLLDRALPHVNKALAIYPEYGQSHTCKAGIMASYYKYDRDLAKLLDEFYKLYEVRPTRPVLYLNSYLDYLNRAAPNKQMLVDFYYKTAYELIYKKHGNTPNAKALAKKYLLDAQKLMPQDERINRALREIG